jgi:hypothetical protein
VDNQNAGWSFRFWAACCEPRALFCVSMAAST